MNRLCPPHLRPVVRKWREPGSQFTGWQFPISQLDRDNRAGVLDRPPATTFADAAAIAFGQTARATARHLRAAAAAILAGWRTYREKLHAQQ